MILIKNLYKKLNEKIIFEGLCLNVKKGETIAIIGKSGCGKSVLLKHIIGILKPDQGQILIDQVNINEISMEKLYEIRKKFGMVFQGGALFDSLTIAENVFFGLDERKDLSLKEKYEIAQDQLNRVGLSNILDKLPSELSGGMRKRVAIARALAIKPEILLYDEPTTGLDPITGDSINELIKEISASVKATSIVVTHDMASAYKVANRIAMLYDGKIIFEGTPEQVRNTKDKIVYQFINGISRS